MADEQLNPAESYAWRKWAGHLPSEPRRKKKRKKKKLPRAPRPRQGCRRLCDHQRQVPAVRIPVMMQRQVPPPCAVLGQAPGLMVQNTVVRPQLPSIYGRRHSLSSSRGSSPWSRLFTRPQRFSSCCLISGGRCPCCAGCAVSPVLPWRRSWRSHSCRSLRNRRPFFLTAVNCGLSAVAVHQHRRRHPFRAANADPHGPDYSADYRVSTVAVRFRCSIPLLCWSCCVPLGCCRPRSSASWPVWTKSTVTVACTILVMPVAMHLALFFVPVCRPMLLGIMAFLDQRLVAVACVRLVLLVFMHFALCSLEFFYGR